MIDLYIIHGWTYTVEPWKNTLRMLIASGINVKMLHVPGLTEPSKKEFSIDDYVKWADREIPDGAIALGHSNGGRILLNLCAAKPEKLKSLILLDSAGIYEPSARKRIVEKVAKIGKPLKKLPLVDKVFHRITGSTDYSRAPENMKVTLANMLESDKNLDFSKVTTRTFILWGKKDTTTPPRQATAMYEKLPNAELKFYARWTHAPYISNPEELAKAISMVLKKANSANDSANGKDENGKSARRAVASRKDETEKPQKDRTAKLQKQNKSTSAMPEIRTKSNRERVSKTGGVI